MLIFRLGTVFCTLQVSFFNPEEKKNEQKVVLKKTSRKDFDPMAH